MYKAPLKQCSHRCCYDYLITHNQKSIGYVPPTDTGSLCLAVDSTHTPIPGLFRLLVRRSGTHCQMNSEIQCVMSTALNSSLNQSCSAFTGVNSKLKVNFNVMCSINSYFTYLLTYLKHNLIIMSLLDEWKLPTRRHYSYSQSFLQLLHFHCNSGTIRMKLNRT